MRILFLAQVLPYPTDAGPKVRAYYTLRHLARKHEITLVSFVRPTDSAEAVEHLRGYCAAVRTVPMVRSRWADLRHLARSLTTDVPFLIARDWSPDMARLVQMLMRTQGSSGQRCSVGFDAVHADQLWTAPYALLARHWSVANTRPLLTLDQHNATFQIPRRLAQHEPNPVKRALLRIEERKMGIYEASTCRKFDHLIWVSQEDQSAVRMRTSGEPPPSTVIPICVDPARQAIIEPARTRYRVTFLGGLHWPPNAEGIRWFARAVWPRVRQQTPHAVLTVIGKNPPRSLLDDSARRNGIHVTGYVQDPAPYLAESAVFIVPLRAGGGMRVKILDAWCWGVPVVTTRIGAEGIDVHEGDNALLADTPDAISRAVVRLLRDPGLAARLAEGGRHTVETDYDWRERYQAWDQVLGTFHKYAPVRTHTVPASGE